ncbi:MAG TPA: hypothetical protein VGO39_06620 [Gaiellaceae bacterium]|nr:hypothetical protein [Gaiellaceae bacterium]
MIVVALSGRVCAGKTTLGEAIVEVAGGLRVSTREILVRHAGTTGRAALQRAGASLDLATRGAWVPDGVLDEVALLAETPPWVIVDSIRIPEQLDRLSSTWSVCHVHVTAPESVLERRYEALVRSRGPQEFATYAEVAADPTESRVENLRAVADLLVDTSRVAPEGAIELIAAGLSNSGKPELAALARCLG